MRGAVSHGCSVRRPLVLRGSLEPVVPSGDMSRSVTAGRGYTSSRRWLMRYLSEGTPSLRDVAKVTASSSSRRAD